MQGKQENSVQCKNISTWTGQNQITLTGIEVPGVTMHTESLIYPLLCCELLGSDRGIQQFTIECCFLLYRVRKFIVSRPMTESVLSVRE